MTTKSFPRWFVDFDAKSVAHQRNILRRYDSEDGVFAAAPIRKTCVSLAEAIDSCRLGAMRELTAAEAEEILKR